jgi:Fur family ferric uptake transcriptional regulator
VYDSRREVSAGEVRSTRQRAAIAGVLDTVDSFLTAQDIHAVLREREERVGLATVYRCLQNMVDTGQVDVLFTADGEATYRRCSPGHHHHLVCRSCGRAVEVAGPGIQSWADRVAAEHDFVDVSHTLEIFGVCRACATGGHGPVGPR